MKRVGERGEGKWQQITWEEALSIVADALKEIERNYGARSVLFHGGWGAHASGFEALMIRFASVYGSPNYSSDAQYCYFSNWLAHMSTTGIPGVFLGAADYYNTDYVLQWANDLAGTQYGPVWGNVGYVIAKERGAKLVVIDPQFTATASKADNWIRIRPGTDGALALGMMNVIINEGLYDHDLIANWTVGFEELKERVQDYPPEKVEEITWVPADQIRTIAREYATTERACIYPSFSKLGHYTNGFQAYRAIACLIGITGHFDKIGSNIYTMPCWRYGTLHNGSAYEAGSFKFADTPMSTEPHAGLNVGKKFSLVERVKDVESISDKEFPYYKEITEHVAGRSVVDALIRGKPYPIKGWFEMGGNILMWPNTKRFLEAFRKLDFIVSMNLFMNKSCEYADIVLPACAYLEKEAEATCMGGRAVMLRSRVVEPPGENWDDRQFLIKLAMKMGFEKGFPWNSVEEEVNEELKPTGLTIADLKKEPSGHVFPEIPMEYEKFKVTGFPTPSKKIELKSSLAEKLGADPLPVYIEPQESPISTPGLAKKYPLILINKRLIVFGHSQWKNMDGRLPWCYEQIPGPELTINTKDAESRNIKNGDMIFVESPISSIRIRAKVTEGITPGVIAMPHDFYEANANDLVNDEHSDPFSGFAERNGLLVQARKSEV